MTAPTFDGDPGSRFDAPVRDNEAPREMVVCQYCNSDFGRRVSAPLYFRPCRTDQISAFLVGHPFRKDNIVKNFSCEDGILPIGWKCHSESTSQIESRRRVRIVDVLRSCSAVKRYQLPGIPGLGCAARREQACAGACSSDASSRKTIRNACWTALEFPQTLLP